MLATTLLLAMLNATPALEAPSSLLVAETACTRTAPCTGTRGGRYYVTENGRKRYLRQKAERQPALRAPRQAAPSRRPAASAPAATAVHHAAPPEALP